MSRTVARLTIGRMMFAVAWVALGLSLGIWVSRGGLINPGQIFLAGHIALTATWLVDAARDRFGTRSS